MKYNPITKEVFSDEGQLIKKLDCPFRVKWEDLNDHHSTFRKCLNCDRSILDTKYLSEEELIETMNKDPNTCLKLDFNQDNVKIITNLSK